MRQIMRGLFVVLAGTGMWAGATGSAQALPCAGFTDVDDTSPFCGNVTWLKNRGVTLGCAPGLYCPADFVSRLQMAIFMNRLGDSLFPLTCAAGQVMKWDGLQWACANDAIGGGGGGGTVTSVAAGTGLQGSPNPITGAGSINLAPGYQLPQTCSNGQVPKSNGAGGWACGADAAGTGSVTSLSQGTGITLSANPITTTGTIAVNTATIQVRVTGTCTVGNYVRAIAADGTVTCGADNGGAANAYVQSGNSFGSAAVLGTNDNQPLDLRVNGSRVMRYEPNAISPNVIGGSPANNVTAGVRGATIGGGGVPPGDTDPDFGAEAPNRVTDVYGTVAGGYGNRAGNDAGTAIDAQFATVGGGSTNTASGANSTVGGGGGNSASGFVSTIGGGSANQASADYSTVGGGIINIASGIRSSIGGGGGNQASEDYTTVGGGVGNTASGHHGTVGGGSNNTAYDYWSTVGGGDTNYAEGRFGTIGGGRNNITLGEDDTVGGGGSNTASGDNSTVPGGHSNLAQGDYSFAAGTRARALHHNSFVWGGSTTIDTNSIAAGDFVVYAPTAIRMYAGAPGSGGCTLTSGASGWSCSSDRTLKSDVAPVDGAAVLEQLAALPIARWSFASVPGTAHMGPMAQDFHAAFGLGDDATRLAPMDVQGVALAAIQGLYAQVRDRDATISTQRQEIAEQSRQLAAQSAALANHSQELAALRDRIAQVEFVRGELAALRNAVAALTTAGTVVAARKN